MNIDYKRFSPIAAEVEEGKVYLWCGCGKSSQRPFCDRTGSCELAVSYTATLNETLYFCGCTRTKTPPLCDGTHGKLLLDLLKKESSA